MRKSFILEGNRYGYVSKYYDSGQWVDVEDYNIREAKNIPPIIVTSHKKENGEYTYTSNCKTEGFYDWCNILSSYSSTEKISFEDLNYVAKKLNVDQKFNRTVYTFWSGKTILPALVTNANNFLISEYNDIKDFISTLESYGANNIYTFGKHSVLFDFEVPE